LKAWRLNEVSESAVRAVAGQTGVPGPVAEALVRRGLTEGPALDRFLNPRLRTLSDPFELPGMAEAVDRIWAALERDEPVGIFGDYDVDGITSAVLLVEVLSALGSRATPYIPNRTEEGYGLTAAGLEQCLARTKPRLLITVDCGTNAAEAVDTAVAGGVDVVVTDHHEPSSEKRAAPCALVNPKLGDDPDARQLAGVGVAFKLCHALVKAGRAKGNAAAERIDLREYLDLVAVGTISDIVPLRGENRILARHGLARLGDTRRCGLRALMDVAGVQKPVTAYHVGFGIGPRLNAAGRMSDAGAALELLLTTHVERAQKLSMALDAANRERQATETRILNEAVSLIDRDFDPARHFAVTVGEHGWHRGVIGIVASRLVSRYRRPVAVIALEEDGVGHGSCRGIEAFSLIQALEQCAELLERFGGHELAAGLEVQESKLEALRERLNAVASESLAGRDLREIERIDAWVPLAEADERLYDAVELLRPFGKDNPTPVWASHDVQVLGTPRVVGSNHLKLTFGAQGMRMDAIGFGMGRREIPDGPIDVAFQLQKNTFRGVESLEMKLRDFRAAEGEGGEGGSRKSEVGS